MKKKIKIIGAGPTGLITALNIVNKSEFEVELFDAQDTVGGLAASVNIDGMICDWGPHIFHSAHKDITEFWLKNFGDLLIKKDFFYKNYKDGIYYNYPISWESINKFPKNIKKKVEKEIKNLKPENLMRARNFKECVIELVGPTLQKIFFEKYTEKLWGLPPEKMSPNWAPKRIELRKKHKAFWSGQFSACGKYGAGAIMDRMAKTIQEKGGKIHTKHRLKKINIVNNKITNLHFENGKDYKSDDSIIVSTIPLNNLCKTMKLPCDLMFNSVRLMYMVFSKDRIFPKNTHSIYFAHSSFDFHRASEQKQYSDTTFPKGKSIIVFEISYTQRKHLGTMSDKELSKRILKQFCSLGFVKKEDFLSAQSVKMPNVNPVMKIGYEKELSKINSKISKIDNLHLAGGSAEFIYGDIQTMVARGNDMADLLISNHYAINKNLKKSLQFKFNENVEIYGHKIGLNHPTMVIAEIGINHRGNLEAAKKLVLEAKKSGCEIAKIQTYKGKDRVSNTSKEAKYADKTLGMEETTSEMFSRFELSLDDHKKLMEYSESIKMPLMSTPFDEKSADQLYNLGVKAFKIASFDLVNLPFIKYVASKKLPIILSTGMANMNEIEEAVEAVAKVQNENLIILHCVSAYPADITDVNMSVIRTLRNNFKIPIGYSDHTIGPLASQMAFTLQADMVEKHFTLDNNLEGPDHIHSSNPLEMKNIIQMRNDIVVGLGDGIKRPAPIEYEQINLQRKSIFAKKNIKKNEILNLNNIIIKGPGHGLLPRYLPIILGKKVTKSIKSDTPITWDEILS